MSTEPSLTARELAAIVEGVTGVRGLESGIASAFAGLDARLRRIPADLVRPGLRIDPHAARIIVEVSLEAGAPVRGTVEEIQRRLAEAARSAGAPPHEILVRVLTIG